MRKIRVKFIKDETVKYLGHLDILRTFGRAIRRSGVPIIYSQGFNPHPSMSFALPLSVGVTSEGEYVDMDIEGEMSPKELVDTLNNGLPNGLKSVSAEEVDVRSNAMADVRWAKYRVRVEGKGLNDINKKVEELLNIKEVIVLKETKSGTKEADIRTDIRELSVLSARDKTAELTMGLSAGSVSNLKPEFVIEGLKKYCEVIVDDIEVHRVELGF